MTSTLNNASAFLITTLFDLVMMLFILRIVLVYARVDYYNPICQFVTKLTQFLVLPLRRIMPNIKHIELASVLIVIMLAMIKFGLLGMLFMGHVNPAGLVVLGFADTLKSLLNIFFYAILIDVMMSWVQTGYSPVAVAVHQVTLPIMRPFRRLIPPVQGFDITPIPVLILLQLFNIVFITPLMIFGEGIAFG